MNKRDMQYAIVGGGIGGLSTAVALQRKGFNIIVYEAAPAFKPLGAGLALAGNAVKAYQDIGIEAEIVGAGKQLADAFIKDENGRVISQTDIREMTRLFGVLNSFTIHRADLHERLVSLLQPGTLVFGKAVNAITTKNDLVAIGFGDGTQANAHFVIAADGIHSVIRKHLMPGAEPRYSGYTCWRAVIDKAPPEANLDEACESWGRGRRFGVVPLAGNRIYWFATLNAKQNDSAMRKATVKDLEEVYKGFHSPIPQVLALTRDEQLIWGDIIDLKPINRFAFPRILLIGDAAHATTPNLGQGACMAIEDAATVANALDKYEPQEAFQRFEQHRLKRTASIVNQSWTLGRLAQWENGMLRTLRNAALRRVPQRMIRQQLQELYDVTFTS